MVSRRSAEPKCRTPPPPCAPLLYILPPHTIFWSFPISGKPPSLRLPTYILLGMGCTRLDYSPLGWTLVHSAGLLESTRVDYVGCWAVDAPLNRFYFSPPW